MTEGAPPADIGLIEGQTRGVAAAEVHRLRTDDNREVALTRVPARLGAFPHATPVLLVHGNFSNRGFWISPKGIGLAPFLSARGYDVWIAELRGHGLSPKEPDFASITAEDHIRGDLPAAATYIAELTGKRMFLVGHSAGGIFVACFLAAVYAADSADEAIEPHDPEADRHEQRWAACRPDRFLGAALFGAQMAGGEVYLKIPPLAFLSAALLRLLGRVPAPRLGLGPEDEPAGEMLEFLRWKKLGGKWQDSRGFSYPQGLQKVRTPVLAVAAARDRNDPAWGCRELMETFGSPDKRFVLLARQEGFSTDFDHIGMIVSKEAGREVWPLLADWLDERRSR